MGSPAFRLVTLGRLTLIDPAGSEDQSLVTRRRKLALLVVLAVSRKPVSRDTLVELFWGDQIEERAKHSLSDALSHLRRALGAEAIATRRAEVALTPGTPLAVDLVELHAAAQAKRWEEVTRLYGGPFLEGVHVHDSPRWEQWISTQRATADRFFLTACAHECARLAAAAEWDACAALAARWRERDPDSSDARRAEEVARAALAEPSPASPTALATVAPRETMTAAPDEAHLPRTRRWLAAAAGLILLMAGAAALWPREAVGGPSRFDERYITTAVPEAREAYLRSFPSYAARGPRGSSLAEIERALALDSTFALAWRRLGVLLDGDESQRARVHDALEKARSVSASASEYERQLILGTYHTLVSGDLARAAAAYRAVLEIDSNAIEAWHNLGMVYQYLGDDQRAAEAYGAANALAPNSAARWTNLIDVRFAAGDTAGARAAIDTMAEHLAGHPSVYVMSATFAAATGDLERARTQLRSYMTASPADARTQAFGRMYRSRVEWTDGALDAGDADAREAMERNLARGDSVWAMRDGLALAQATYWLRGDRERAASVLHEVLARIPPASLRPLDRPWLEIASTAAFAGDLPLSRTALRAWSRDVPEPVRLRDAAARHLAEGTVALVERRVDAAVRHLEQAATPECRVCGLVELGLAHEARGDTAAARRAFVEYLTTPTLRRVDLLDALHLRWVRTRIAR